ncbi:MAG TPA: hypothetical protein VMM77_09570 [Gemmatimonadaceae bacterium]|nr:hypothetical protein [Gemmatimonadaceae bacterium]
MRSTRILGIAAVAVTVAACGNQPKSSAPDAALSRDLALAASEAMELAPNGSGHPMLAAELPPPIMVAQRHSVAKKPSPHVEPLPEPVSIEPAEIVAIADVPQMTESPAGAPVEIERPAPARRPAPMPVDYPVHGGEGPNDGGGVGPIIGVVIRGGAVGHDNCKKHPSRGGSVFVGTRGPIGIARGPVIRGGVAINNRIPPRTAGTFPR